MDGAALITAHGIIDGNRFLTGCPYVERQAIEYTPSLRAISRAQWLAAIPTVLPLTEGEPQGRGS